MDLCLSPNKSLQCCISDARDAKSDNSSCALLGHPVAEVEKCIDLNSGLIRALPNSLVSKMYNSSCLKSSIIGLTRHCEPMHEAMSSLVGLAKHGGSGLIEDPNLRFTAELRLRIVY